MIDEEVAKAAGITLEELHDLGESVFRSTEGQKFIEALCRWRNPLERRFTNGDSHQAAQRDGECLTVGLIWKLGSSSPSVPE